MTTKEGEAAAKEFTLSLPEDTEALVFCILASPTPPWRNGHTVLWVRAKEPGGDWGQSACIEVIQGNQEHHLFRSKPMNPGALWMEPSKTYTLEVVPEGLIYPDIHVSCVRRPEPPAAAPPAPPEAGSVLDSPVFWIAALVGGVALALARSFA